MDKLHEGLRKVASADWRGGVACRELRGGEIAVGDDVSLEFG